MWGVAGIVVVDGTKRGRPGGGDVKQIVRWWVAALVTVTTFSLSTWICGALVLPPVMKDPAIRWGVAAGLGVAMAAPAALWGPSVATARPPAVASPTTPGSAGNKETASRPGAIHVGANASRTLSTRARTPHQPPPTEPA